MAEPTFKGIPAEGLKFLADLANNNNRDWFEANKSTFTDRLQTPAQAFVATLGERLQAVAPGLVYDTRVNGSGSLMRIYRDVRFSKDKTPYKTNISMAFWEGPSKKAAYSGFYIRFEADAGAMMTGLHGFDKPLLAAYRDAVLDDELGSELEAVLDQVQASGQYTIGGELYKKVPRGFDPDHPRAELLRYKGLHVYTLSLDPKTFTSAELVDVCFEHCAKTAPLHHWLVQLGQRVPA